MRIVETVKKFEKDMERLKKRGKKFAKLQAVIDKLMLDIALDYNNKPHPLSGNWDGYWELHIEPDWLLIYNINDTVLTLIRTGTHADLF